VSATARHPLIVVVLWQTGVDDEFARWTGGPACGADRGTAMCLVNPTPGTDPLHEIRVERRDPMGVNEAYEIGFLGGQKE
jgi:hypothetical protein